MCIACALPQGTKISQKEFENCWDHNPHGGGYVFIGPDGKFMSFKSMEYEPFRKAFEHDHKKYGEHSPFMLHFRIKSQGTIDLSNVHPFKVNEDVFMMHNGTFHFMPTSQDRSDTRMLVEDYLSTLPRNFLRNKGIVFALDKLFGTNRVVFLDKQGEFAIFNKRAGTDSEGRWFSNTDFKFPKTVTTSSTQSGGKTTSPISNSEYEWSGRKVFKGDSRVQANYLHQCVICKALFEIKHYNVAYKCCDACKHDAEQWGKRYGLYLDQSMKIFIKVAKAHDVPPPTKAKEPKDDNILALPAPTLIPAQTLSEWASKNTDEAMKSKYEELGLYY